MKSSLPLKRVPLFATALSKASLLSNSAYAKPCEQPSQYQSHQTVHISQGLPLHVGNL